MHIDIERYIKASELISEERLNKYKKLLPPQYAPMVMLPYFGMQFNAALFYPTIQLIEICLRNKIYFALKALYTERSKAISLPGAPEEWYMWMPQQKRTQQAIASALSDAKKNIRSRDIIPGDIVCRLTFGDWLSILEERSDDKDPLYFWRYVKKDIFPNTSGNKKTILNEVRWAKSMRNRLSHHEPLWTSSELCTLENAKKNIYAKHNRLLEIIHWMSEDMLYAYASDEGFRYKKYFQFLIEQAFDAYNVFWEFPDAVNDTAPGKPKAGQED